MVKTNRFGALAVAAGALVAAALLVLMVVNPQTAGAALPGDNGRIAYSGTDTAPGQRDLEIYTIPATGGLRSQLTFNDTSDTNPCYSPDGFRIGYFSFLGNNDRQIFTMPNTGGARSQVTPDTAQPSSWGCSFTGPRGSDIYYTGIDPTGSDSEIYTIPATGGTPINVTNNDRNEYHPSFAVTGSDATTSLSLKRIAYMTIDPTGSDSEIYTIPATGGTPINVTNNDRSDVQPDYRPDGERIVYSGGGGSANDYDIYTIPATGGTPTQLTNNTIREVDAVYSPDGQRIAYQAHSGGTFDDWEIYTIPATGGTPTQLTDNKRDDIDPTWQPRP
jgi:Tol biopolymer transport system component